jgi:fatty acid desaturase
MTIGGVPYGSIELLTASRDYSLVGTEKAHATERGLSSAEWYRSPVPRTLMRELMRRSDRRALVDTFVWLGLLIGSGWLAHVAWGSWWAVPAFAVYGVLYGSVSDSRWHECGHGTAFATAWMNTAVYYLASFMVMREPVSWRWSHVRHHSDTIIVGLDPEIAYRRPTPRRQIAAELFGLLSISRELHKLALNIVGRFTADELEYLPLAERGKAIRAARLYVLILAAVVAWSIVVSSVEPLMFVGLPSIYGRWLLVVYGTTQHAGLAEDVLDHRLNSRTVLMNPVNRFLYWNMNYHVEHHMFPSVPYHALPSLHAAVRDDMPPPYHGLREAYREIIPALRRQRREPEFFVQRVLPRPVDELS